MRARATPLTMAGGGGVPPFGGVGLAPPPPVPRASGPVAPGAGRGLPGEIHAAVVLSGSGGKEAVAARGRRRAGGEGPPRGRGAGGGGVDARRPPRGRGTGAPGDGVGAVWGCAAVGGPPPRLPWHATQILALGPRWSLWQAGG